MTKVEENKVRKLVHEFLHSDITAVEFREELDRITGRRKPKKSRKAAFHGGGDPPPQDFGGEQRCARPTGTL